MSSTSPWRHSSKRPTTTDWPKFTHHPTHERTYTIKIPANCPIEKIASTDQTRSHLLNAWLDVAGKRLVTTNGHALALVKVDPEAHDVDGYVMPDALKAARKASKLNNDETVIMASGSLTIPNGPTFARPTVDAQGNFPPVDQVIPPIKPGDAGTFTFGINPKLLHDLADAIGSGKCISLTVSTENPLAPILVNGGSPSGNIGVIMPCRV